MSVMTKKIICVATVLSMVISTAQAKSAQLASKPSAPYEVDQVLIPSQTELCHGSENFLTLSKRSQTNLNSLFDNVACNTVGSFVSSDKLDINYCRAVKKCKNFEAEQKGEGSLGQKEKDFLSFQSMNFLMRENINREMDKYSSVKAEKLKDLSAYVDKLPAKFKNSVVRCEEAKVATGKCLEDSDWDQIAKAHITEKYYSDMADQLNSHRSSSLTKYGLVLGRSQRKQSIGDVFISLQNDEDASRDWSLKNSNDLEASKDGVLDRIMTEILTGKNADVSKISNQDLKKLVRDSILKFNSDLSKIDGKSDTIFRYNALHADQDLDAAMNDIDFSPKDFIVDDKIGRKALSDKINAIRVNMANEYFKEDCGQVNTNIAQVCSNVAKSLESGQVIDILSENKDDIFKKIIDYYQGRKDQDKLEKINTLIKMENAHNKVYQKYLSYMMEVNACEEKFAELKSHSPASAARKQMIMDQAKAMEVASQAIRDEKSKVMEDIIKRDEPLQRELRQAGIKLNPDIFKSDSISQDAILNPDMPHAKSETAVIGARSDEFINTQKNYYPDPNINTHQNKGFDPNMNEAMNNLNAIEDNRRNRDEDLVDSKVRARLAELENREKTLSKKSQTNLDGDKEGKTDSTELENLRQQIEELKNQKALSSKEKEKGSNATEALKEPERVLSAPSDSGNKGPSIFGSNKNSYTKNDDNNAPETAASAARSMANATQGPDYSNAGTSINAASRAIASVNPLSTGGGKGSSEKSATGIVLTKTGEVMIDPANIIDNPNEGEISNLIEQTRGQPFLIRENGVLMKVTVELDAKGKPQVTSDGKLRFKKVRLSKAQQETIAKETNIQKAAKEVGREPTRLFKLKSLINETVQRE